jgi:VanZ family protein
MRWEMILFAVTGLAVVVGCLVPNSWLPPLPNDKLLHFGAYGALTVLALRMAPDGAAALLAATALLLAGWLIELLQSRVPGRKFCWRDIGANAAGIVVAALLTAPVSAAIGRF